MVFVLVLLAIVRLVLLVLDYVATSPGSREGSAVNGPARAATAGTSRSRLGRPRADGNEPRRPIRRPGRDVPGPSQVASRPRIIAALGGGSGVATKGGGAATFSAAVVVTLICASTAISFYDAYLVYALLAR